MRRRFLVLGGAGYIGAQFCQHLLGEMSRPDDELVCYDNLRYNNGWALSHLLGEPKFRLVVGDIRCENLLRKEVERADVVFHLAALVGAPVCDRYPEDADQVNRVATQNLVKMLSPGQRLYYLNSNSGYGQTDGISEVNEESPLNPISLYGRTKVEGEKAVLDHKWGTSFRLATVFGISPRMRFDLMVNDWTNQLTEYHFLNESAASIFTFPIFEPHFYRNYVHVRDVCRALIWASSNVVRGLFNLGHPEANRTKWQLAETICEVLHVPPSVLRVKEDTVDADQRNYKVSNRRILDAGFRFAFPLEQGIREVGEICRVTGRHNSIRMRNVGETW